MQAVILAAGRGTRLLPITQKRSKAMLPILGKPILIRIIQALASCGIESFILVTNPTNQEITSYFRSFPFFGIEIQLVEQTEPRGMAHALNCVEPWIIGNFILSACDSLLSLEDYAQLISAWSHSPTPAALLALEPISPDQTSRTAIVIIDNGTITRIIEKPTPNQVFSYTASLPIYLLDRGIFPHLSHLKPSRRGELELQDAIQALIDSKANVYGEYISSRFNLTSAKDLLDINMHFLEIETPHLILENVHLGKKVSLIPPYFIGANTIIEDECVIGPKVFIESNALIGNGCRLSNSVLLQGSRLTPLRTIYKTIIYP